MENNINIKITFILFLCIITIFIMILDYENKSESSKYESVDKKNKIIYFGQTLDLSNNKVSINYSQGYELAFNSINRIGGINGYKLKIILYDDKYEPELAYKNSKILVDYFNVLALIGPFGTPTTLSILNNTIKERPIPVIAPFSAGLSYRKYFNKYLILTNSTLLYEFELTINNMILNNIKNISIIYQNDTYGLAFFNSIVEYMIKHKIDINIISSGSYERNTIDLKKCFESIFDVKNAFDTNEYSKSKTYNNIQAILLLVAQEQLPYILGFIKKNRPQTYIYYNFFVDTSKDNYSQLSNYDKENIYQTNLIYNINNSYPILYNKFIDEVKYFKNQHKKKIDINSSATIYGFYSGLLIIEVLKNIYDLSNVTREKFIEIFYKIQNFDLYGLKIGPFVNGVNNQGVNFASISKLNVNTLEMELIKELN